MPRPPIPSDEEERLAALERYAVLDTPSEPEFDRLTSLAARMFDAPMALLSLVSRDRQWFKSRIGIDECQTSRDEAFCAYTILSPEPFIISDATRDPRFTDHSLVTGAPHIRFYAGAPLIAPEGQRLGTLCVLDTAPRQFSAQQARMLSDLAAIAMDSLELRLARRRPRNGAALPEAAAPAFLDSRQAALAAASAAEQREADLLRSNAALREAEAQFAKEREQLEERVRARAAELAEANEALREEVAIREHAEAAVRRSESKFRALLENTQDLITIADTDCVALYTTPSVQHILGYGSNELLGVSLFQFVHPEDKPAVDRCLNRILREGAAFVRCEYRFRHKDGSWRLLESVGSLMPADSPIVGLVINSRDITEREVHARQQETSANLGRLALRGPTLETMFEAVAKAVTHALGVKLSTVNELLPGGEKLLVRAGDGWQAGLTGQMIVSNWRRAAGEMDRVDSDPLIIPDLRQDALLYPLLSAETLREQPISAVSVLIHSGGKAFGTLCALSTELRQFSRQDVHFLQTAAHLLSSFIERQNREEALRAAKDEAERANAAKSEFLSRMSHELRTPLNAILGFGQLLELEDLGPRNHQSVQHVLTAGRHLLGLVDEVLDIAHSQASVANAAGDPAAIEAALNRAIEHLPLPPEEASPPAPPSLGARTVLHIEDNAMFARFIERLLKSRPSIRVLTAHDGHSGLAMAREHQPDLILLDLLLPDIPGAEVLSRLRDYLPTSAIPTLVLTIDGSAAQIARLRQLGVYDYLTKPLDAGEFLRAVDGALAPAAP